MDRLIITQRLLLSTVAFIALITVLAYFFQESVSINVDFAKQERLGNAYQRPLTKILAELSAYQILLTSPQTPDKATLLATKVDDISAGFAELKKVDAFIGATLLFTPAELAARHQENTNAAKVQEKWAAISVGSKSDIKATLDKVQSVVADIRSMISYMGNSSNLILDPELNSYYVADVTLGALPQTIDRIGAAGSEVSLLLANGQPLTTEERGELNRLASMFTESDITRITGDVDTALNEDSKIRGGSPTLKSGIEDAVKHYKQANEALAASLKAMGVSGQKVTAEDWAKTTHAALASSAQLWDAAVAELNTLFDTRIKFYSQHIFVVLSYIVGGFILAIGFFLVVINSIRVPLKEIHQAMNEIAHGDLDVKVPHLAKRDEIGEMAHSLQLFKENAEQKIELEKKQLRDEQLAKEEKTRMMHQLADDFQNKVQGIVTSVSSASTELFQSAGNMREIMSSVLNLSNTAMNTSGETSANVNNVSAAVEEMSSSVKEISHQINKTSMLVADTVLRTQRADEKVHALAEAVQKINNIVELIDSIAGQINLLALNATIESARAGEAGKGFAVVASEVKSLAGQTSKATEEITAQILSVRTASEDVMSVLKDIKTSIDEVSQYSGGIASAAEEQSAATSEISSNMQQASRGVGEINESIGTVTHSASEASHNSNEVLKASEMLSKQSELLDQQVRMFLQDIRNA